MAEGMRERVFAKVEGFPGFVLGGRTMGRTCVGGKKGKGEIGRGSRRGGEEEGDFGGLWLSQWVFVHQIELEKCHLAKELTQAVVVKSFHQRDCMPARLPAIR